MAKLKMWSVLKSFEGRVVDVCWTFKSPAQNPRAAFESMPMVMQERYKEGYVIRPWPKRLNVRDERTLTFEVPGLENENLYRVEVNEVFANIGFQFCLITDTAAHLRIIAPASAVRKLASCFRLG